MKAYGTLEPLQEEKRSTRSKLLIVVGVLACVAVLGFGVARVQVSSTVDTNRGRSVATPMDKDVQTAFQNVCDRALPLRAAAKTIKDGKEVSIPARPRPLRFSVAGLKKEQEQPGEKPQYKLVPMVSYAATDDWMNDWEMFKQMMPDDSPAVGYGLYNFPVWEDPNSRTRFKIYSTFVSFQRANKPVPDISSKYLGGSFLGSALLAGSGSLNAQVPRPAWVKAPDAGRKRSCAIASIAIDQTTTYKDACVQVVTSAPGAKETAAQARLLCNAVNLNNCPFGARNPGSPCNLQCKKVASWMDDQYGKPCCDAIKAWCANPKTGCQTKYHQAIYKRNCDPSYGTANFEKVLLLDGLAGEKTQCLDSCKNSCTVFADGKKTYQECAGCSVKLKKQLYGKTQFVAMCHPKAPGFVNFRCCGLSPNCIKENVADKCNVVAVDQAGDECSFLSHAKCVEKVVAIKAARVKAAEEAAKKAAEEEKKKAAEEAAKLLKGKCAVEAGKKNDACAKSTDKGKEACEKASTDKGKCKFTKAT